MMKIAVVFPGQGSQSVGMLFRLSERYEVVRSTFAQASEVLQYDLWDLVQKGPKEELNQTCCAQPALLAASFSIWRIWLQEGFPQPHFFSGHSLGEYSALTCAGSIDFVQAIKLVELRGQLMQEVAPVGTGAMSAIIGLDKSMVAEICKEIAGEEGGVVSPANFNSLEQVVISGHKKAVERAGIVCKKAGAKVVLPLSVSIPSHCILMRPAARKLAKFLKSIRLHAPKIPVISNADAAIVTEPEKIKEGLVRQLYNPVRWVEIIQKMDDLGIERLVEVGPGEVLTNLARRTVKTLKASTFNDASSSLELFR